MKTKTTILLLMIFSSMHAFSQTTFKPGIRAGANFSDLTKSELQTKTGFYLGFIGGLQLSKYYTLQPEVSYTQQGAKGDYFTYNDKTGDYTSNYEHINLNYASFGIINKFTFNNIMNFHIGPSIDIEVDQDKLSNFPIDLAMTVGVGFDFPGGLGLEFRAKKGIVDVLDSSGYNRSNYIFDNWKYNTNILFQLGLSYTFKIKD